MKKNTQAKKTKKVQRKSKKTNTDTKSSVKKINGISEEEFLEVFNIITKKLIYKFRFGYHDVEDMKQQAAIFAVEGLKKYDHKRPLENFLWTHVRNRLFNYKRDNYQRPDKPCATCPLYQPNNPDGDCKEHRDKMNCSLYESWYTRNNNKKNIMQPTYIDSMEPENKDNFLTDVHNKDMINKIEDKLPVKYRDVFLKIIHGVRVSKTDRFKVQNYIKVHILEELKNND